MTNKVNVLIVDDNPKDIDRIKRLLDNYKGDFEIVQPVFEARDLPDAKRKLNKLVNKKDDKLLFLDLDFPTGDPKVSRANAGYTLHNECKEQLKNVTVIVISDNKLTGFDKYEYINKMRLEEKLPHILNKVIDERKRKEPSVAVTTRNDDGSYNRYYIAKSKIVGVFSRRPDFAKLYYDKKPVRDMEKKDESIFKITTQAEGAKRFIVVEKGKKMPSNLDDIDLNIDLNRGVENDKIQSSVPLMYYEKSYDSLTDAMNELALPSNFVNISDWAVLNLDKIEPSLQANSVSMMVNSIKLRFAVTMNKDVFHRELLRISGEAD